VPFWNRITLTLVLVPGNLHRPKSIISLVAQELGGYTMKSNATATKIETKKCQSPEKFKNNSEHSIIIL